MLQHFESGPPGSCDRNLCYAICADLSERKNVFSQQIEHGSLPKLIFPGTVYSTRGKGEY